MKSTQHIFLITTYCDTKEKVDLLKDTIQYLKDNHSNLDIMVYAHYPIPFEIQQNVKFYVYDSTNPLIDMKIKVWVEWWYSEYWLGYPSKILNILPDTGWAVLSMWEKGLKYLKSHGYKYAHILDYDLDVLDTRYYDMIKDNINKLESGTEALFTEFENDLLSLTNGSVNIDAYINKILPLITMDSYLSDISQCLENYFSMIIRSSNIIYEFKNISILNFCRSQGIYKKKIPNLRVWCGKDLIDNSIKLIINDETGTNIEKIVIEFNINSNYIITLKEPSAHVVIDITHLNPHYIKIVEYNGVKQDYTIISKIDENYLKNHYIERL